MSGPQPRAILTRIEHREPHIVQEVLLTQAGGSEQRLVFRFATNGEETTNAVGGGMARTQARWDGAELVIESWLDAADRKLYFKDHWSLSADGRTLTMAHRDDALAGQIVVNEKAPHPLDDTIALLSRSPAALDALLRDLPDTWTHRTEGADTWTVHDVVGHLIHGDQTDWMPRARIILEHGETRAFEPFDMQGHVRVCQGKSLGELLDEFAQLRAAKLADLRALDLLPEDLERLGRHPALGSVTLGQLLATWAAHDLTHLHQISRIMAHQYRAAVGPWAEYMGVMRCGGHSSV